MTFHRMHVRYWLPKGGQRWRSLSGAEKSGTTDEEKVTGVIEGMQRDGGIYRSKTIAYEAETKGRNEHEQGPGDGMAGQMSYCEQQRCQQIGEEETTPSGLFPYGLQHVTLDDAAEQQLFEQRLPEGDRQERP